MKAIAIIEKYFWIFFLVGIGIALWLPLPFKMPPYLPEVLLSIILFLVFLKIDVFDILEHVRNYKLMAFVIFVFMLLIPLLFFFLINIFDGKIALGILLLTAMPAGVSSPALTDIAKGNISLAMSLAMITHLIAPFTVPLLFWLVDIKDLEINKLLVFKDLALLVFVPLIFSQIVKKFFSVTIRKTQHVFTSVSIILLFAFVYITLSSQSNAILGNPFSLILKTAVLYVVFIILHVVGYMICYKEKKENKIAIAVSAAYMNNGMAIVLASSYFGPEMLVFMVLSEVPWNTLLAPFKRIVKNLG